MYKILICGSKMFTDYGKFSKKLETYLYDTDGVAKFYYSIISGGAEGTDKLAKEYADIHDRHITIIKPDWDKHGKKAGILRNIEMLNLNPNLVIAFWDGKSKGTKFTIDEAIKRKIDVLIIPV